MSSPVGRTEPAVGTFVCRFSSGLFSGGGAVEFMTELEAIDGVERLIYVHRLFVYQEPDDIALTVADRAAVGVVAIDRERPHGIAMKRASPDPAIVLLFE